MSVANITVEREVIPRDNGAKAKSTMDHTVVVRTHDLCKLFVRFHMNDKVSADALQKMLSELLDSMSIVDMEIEWATVKTD